MNKLEQLIQELCPDGVEFYELQEVFDMKNGYTPSKANASFWKNGTIPWFRMEDIRENGRILSDSLQHITPEAVKGNLFPANSIIVATSATIGEHALITVESLANQRFTYLTPKKEYIDRINPMYMYYFCFKLDEWCLNNTNISSFASVDMAKFARFKIPVPPLPVQSEIVRILDNFAELTAELTAELAARKKQYEHYKSKIFEKTRGSTYKALIDIVDVRDGTHDTPKQSTEGFPLVTSKNIINGLVDVSSCYLIAASDYEAINQRSKVDTFDVLMSMIGTIGETAIVNDNSQYAIKNVGLIKCGGNKLLSQYIRFYLTSSDAKQYINANVKGTAPRYLSLTALRNFPIPFLPLEEQKRIVAILDRFDALCNDITSGLPAEIEARRKQYEYYRDKLLTFKEKTA